MKNKFYYSDGTIRSCYDSGKILHREDGPAIEHDDGTKMWYQNGELHREDGPSIEWTNGAKRWYQNGELHRFDGPAVEHGDGDREWYQYGKLHRLDGPAVEWAGADRRWYVRGERLSKEEFNRHPEVLKYRMIEVIGDG